MQAHGVSPMYPRYACNVIDISGHILLLNMLRTNKASTIYSVYGITIVFMHVVRLSK